MKVDIIGHFYPNIIEEDKTDENNKKIAYLIKEDLPNLSGRANLYKMVPEYYGNKYIIASAVNCGIVCETYLFPANYLGNVIDWGELPGSVKNMVFIEKVIKDIGYEIDLSLYLIDEGEET
jgi:hypothetical protein